MELPKMRQPAVSRQTVEAFRGYNHNLRIGDGEFYEMQNMTSDRYPVLSPRGQRGVYAQVQAGGLIAKDSLCYVTGTNFVMNGKSFDMGLNDEPKQLVSMGAYVIILPDKKYFNTQNGEFGNIEAFYPGVESQSITASYAMCTASGTEYGKLYASDTAPPDPENAQLWIDLSASPNTLKQYSGDNGVWTPVATTYVRISAPGIAESFSQYDAVEISGLPGALGDLEGQSCVLWDVYHDPGEGERAKGTNDYVTVVGLLEDVIDSYTSELRLRRTMPEMDFVTESGNRLWGCRYGVAANGQVVNEIYCSKLGDFKNWSCSMGISTDSWVAGCGTDGPFTGAITHLGYPLFFKETCVHKVYGSYPANFQIQTVTCNGVQKDCHNSLAIVNTTLFYKSADGVYAYDGSLPEAVSYALGDRRYSEAVGGAHGNKYYISMRESAGDDHLFVYDTAKGLWHREDNFRAEQFCPCRGELYAISGNEIVTMLGSGTPDTAPVEWMVQTGDIGISSPDTKYISRLTLRLAMDMDAEVRVYALYDFSQEWEQVCVITSDSFRSFSIPIRPKRCDRMRLRIEGTGPARIYSVTKNLEQGGEPA